jgi:hypothetical protein
MYTWYSHDAVPMEVIREGEKPLLTWVCAHLTRPRGGANLAESRVLNGGYQNGSLDALYERLGLPYSLNALPAC